MKTINPISRLEYIDALRGLAFTGVFVSHCFSIYNRTGLPPLNASVAPYVYSADHGVQLFYLISAFTIFYTLEGKDLRKKNELLTFFLKRFFRIAPLFYIIIIGMYLIDIFFYQKNISCSSLLGHLFFVNSFYPSWINNILNVEWSIAIEVVFYCLCPLLYIYINNLRKACWLFIVSILFNYIFTIVLSNHSPITDITIWHQYLYFWLPAQFPVFSLGIIVFFVIKKIFINYLDNKNTSAIMLAFAAVIFFTFTTGGIKLLPGYIIYGIGFVLLTVALALTPYKILVNKFLIFIGKRSYSAYLIHLPLISFLAIPFSEKVKGFLPHAHGVIYFVIFIISISLFVMPFAHFLYKLVEVPFINIGKRVIKTL